jgi:ribosomal protein L32
MSKASKKKSRWWELSKRKERKCESCGKKIKMGRYCYWCGRRKGLW